MKILGITGGIGAGKSTITRYFSELGADIVDADAISRQVLEKQGAAYAEVVAYFGPDILMSNKEIDRKKLAELIFQDEEKRRQLNSITHACIFAEMERQICASEAALVCLDVPLLFSCEFPFHCDKTLAVLAPKELRIQRVMLRDGCSREQVEARMACQLSEEELQKRADYCIMNDGTERDIKEQIKKVYQEMMELTL